MGRRRNVVRYIDGKCAIKIVAKTNLNDECFDQTKSAILYKEIIHKTAKAKYCAAFSPFNSNPFLSKNILLVEKSQ